MKHLGRRGVVRPVADHRASWEWLARDGETVTASIRLAVRTGAEAGTIRLNYSVTDGGRRERMDYPIPLETTDIFGKGRRWWFRCIASRGGGPPCRRRARVLYLPPDEAVFACRGCHGLAYESSRESRQYSGLFNRLGDDMGLSGRETKRVFDGRFRIRKRLWAEERQRAKVEDDEPGANRNGP